MAQPMVLALPRRSFHSAPPCRPREGTSPSPSALPPRHRYDPSTRLYWSFTNPSIDRYGTNADARNILVLACSSNLEDWRIAETVLVPNDGLDWDASLWVTGYQYVDWVFDGPDMLLAIRTAFDGAHSFHDSNRWDGIAGGDRGKDAGHGKDARHGRLQTSMPCATSPGGVGSRGLHRCGTPQDFIQANGELCAVCCQLCFASWTIFRICFADGHHFVIHCSCTTWDTALGLACGIRGETRGGKWRRVVQEPGMLENLRIRQANSCGLPSDKIATKHSASSMSVAMCR